MERVKSLVIILMKERDKARRRVDDLNLELKIISEKVITVGIQNNKIAADYKIRSLTAIDFKLQSFAELE